MNPQGATDTQEHCDAYTWNEDRYIPTADNATADSYLTNSIRLRQRGCLELDDQ